MAISAAKKNATALQIAVRLKFLAVGSIDPRIARMASAVIAVPMPHVSNPSRTTTTLEVTNMF
jgi:hypothetical protein